MTPSTYRLGVSVRLTPIRMLGVLSLVLGAVLVGAAGAAGAAVSTVSGRAALWGLSLPTASVSVVVN